VRAFAAQATALLLRLAAAAPAGAAGPEAGAAAGSAAGPLAGAATTAAAAGTGGAGSEGRGGGGLLVGALRALLAQHALQSSEEVTDGAGRLVSGPPLWAWVARSGCESLTCRWSGSSELLLPEPAFCNAAPVALGRPLLSVGGF